VAAGNLVEELRAVKDAREVEAIREAAKLADAALSTVLESGLAGRTELEVAGQLEAEMRSLGAEEPSFPSIVASGPHGALPHAEPRDVTIDPGVLVTIDWGAKLDGYHSDCTRTFATGELSDEATQVYELVLDAQARASEAVRAGAGAKEVDAASRAPIAAAGHGDHYGHGLGHGVGLEIHEAPRLAPSSNDTLAAGNVVTVEPGVYVPGEHGVRIEDLVVVSDEGCEVLSSLSKELQTVG
jgi:Xaa-Pro aminopeptidase